MKKLILEYLANFGNRWDIANEERRTRLTSEYKSFCYVYGLPKLSVEDMVHDIKRGVVIISEQEEEQEDLFNQLDTLPQEVQDIINRFEETEGYGELEALLLELKPHGYKFEYGLDAIPYNLRKIEQAIQSPTELKEKWLNKLEESKTQPRKFQPHDTPWDFVEEYYPNYSSSDEICACLDLMLKEETEDLSQEEMEQKEYYLKEIYEQSIQNFINSQNK
jgi:hypothetical protein